MAAINPVKDRINELESRKRRLQQKEIGLITNDNNYQTVEHSVL